MFWYVLLIALKMCNSGQELWYMSVILAPRRWRQEDPQFEASLDYLARLCLKKEKLSSEYSLNG
jgi:hypothetical protein